MIKYAKIVNEITKEVSIYEGNDPIYIKLYDVTEQDVEQSWDGSWYIKGYAPEKPQSEINQERINELQSYLTSTDWYAVRLAETGVAIPEDVVTARSSAREEISALRGDK